MIQLVCFLSKNFLTKGFLDFTAIKGIKRILSMPAFFSSKYFPTALLSSILSTVRLCWPPLVAGWGRPLSPSKFLHSWTPAQCTGSHPLPPPLTCHPALYFLSEATTWEVHLFNHLTGAVGNIRAERTPLSPSPLVAPCRSVSCILCWVPGGKP